MTAILSQSLPLVIPAPCECAVSMSDFELLEVLMAMQDRALTLLTIQNRFDEIIDFGGRWSGLDSPVAKLLFAQRLLDGMTVSDAADEIGA